MSPVTLITRPRWPPQRDPYNSSQKLNKLSSSPFVKAAFFGRSSVATPMQAYRRSIVAEAPLGWLVLPHYPLKRPGCRSTRAPCRHRMILFACHANLYRSSHARYNFHRLRSGHFITETDFTINMWRYSIRIF